MKTIDDESGVIVRLRKGDVEAFDHIYNKYSGRLYSFSMKYLQSAAESEELVQSVFLKVWEYHKRIDENLSFKSYLFTIAYNDICKAFRKRKYLKQFVIETISTGSESSSEMEEEIDFQSTLKRINNIIDKLPERQKIIFIKSRYDGKTTKEIAKELKLSPGTVDNYISAAIRFIKDRCRKEDLASILFIFMFLL
ncbi:MAG: RNA polymerase sigma-70 factor [Bacteroidota bacterium]